MADYITIARIVKTRGIRGEVAASLLTDFPERFEQLRNVRVCREGFESWEVLEEHRFHGDRILLKFKGRDRPHEVDELVGGEVQVPQAERAELPADTFYQSDLVTCRVFERDRPLGSVVRVLETGPEGCNLVVRTAGEEEFMIPLVRQFVRRVDIVERRIEVELPSGLLDATRSSDTASG